MVDKIYNKKIFLEVRYYLFNNMPHKIIFKDGTPFSAERYLKSYGPVEANPLEIMFSGIPITKEEFIKNIYNKI